MTVLPEPSEQPTESGPSGAPASDTELLERVRAGDKAAYGALWNRHHRAGLNAARSITSAFDADDLVSEAFVRVLKAIERGNGPTAAFRPYLITTIRSVAARWGAQPAELTPEELEVVDPDSSDEAFGERFDQSLTVRAFNTLPQRWQEVLWYTEAEQLPPREVAAMIGIKPNAVSALAKRAKEGLRHAWVQAHIEAVPADSECRWSIDRLAASTRKSLPAREQDRLDAHLDECDRCPLAAAEMTEASRRLGALILIGFLGAAAATAYGAFLKPATASAATLGAAAFWPPKATHVRNFAIGAGSTVAAGAIAVGAAFAVTGGATPPPQKQIITSVAQSSAAPQDSTDAAPSASAPTSPSPAPSPSPDVASTPPAAAPAPAPARDAAPADPVAASAPSSSPPSRPSSSPAPTPLKPPTHTPAPLAVTEVDTNNGEYFPIVSGTGDPGATITLSESAGSAKATVGADGNWSTSQLTWVPSGDSTLTVTQAPTSGATSTASESVTLTPPAVSVGLAGLLAFTATPNSTVEIVADGVGQSPLVYVSSLGLATAAYPSGATTVEVRYANGAGRHGPSTANLL